LRSKVFARVASDISKLAMALSGLYFGFPARSHTVPGLSIVRELVNRGVQVKYYSTPKFRSLIESSGAQFATYPAVCESLADATDLAGHLQRVVDVTTAILPQLLEDIGARPSFIIHDGSALWGRILARVLAVVSVASITTFAFNRSMVQLLRHGNGSSLDGARLEKLLARLNCSYVVDDVNVIVATGDLKVVYTSRLFQPGGRFFDESHLFVGPLLDARPRDGARVALPGSRPLAYLSLGTIFNNHLGLLNRFSGVLSEAGWQVVVSLGDPVKQVTGEWAPHVQVHPFVDQMAVLSQARLVVAHGGMASVSETLAHGIPLIVIPQGVDQYLVAQRTAQLGAAVVIDDASSIGQWQAALSRISTERAQFVAAAARIGDSFADVTPVRSAVDRLLHLVSPE
jgi:MGT family glycosyltransferase